MLRLYVSIRPLVVGTELLMPDKHFKEGFKGLDIKASLVAENRTIDGRLLYEVLIGEDSGYTPEKCEEYKAIILEGLQAWSVHEKSLQSAKELAETLSRKSFEIKNEKIEILEKDFE